jgi:hypothetical protein
MRYSLQPLKQGAKGYSLHGLTAIVRRSKVTPSRLTKVTMVTASRKPRHMVKRVNFASAELSAFARLKRLLGPADDR